MNTRLCLLALLVGALLTSGCAVSEDIPKATASPKADEQPKAAVLPQAPPHVKKTTAELLVGEWKMVERKDRPVPEGSTAVFEFSTDGTFSILVVSRPSKAPPQGATFGTYTIEGKTIHLDRPETADEPARKWDITIESISHDTLILTGGGDPGSDTLRRIPPKP